MKSCYIRKNDKIEVRAPNGAQSLLFEKLKNHYNDDEKALVKYNDLKEIDYKYKDVNGEPDFKLDTGIRQLDNLLVALQSSGVSIGDSKAFMQENNLRNGNTISVEGIASLAKQTIQ